jgi:hypothetical protein
MGTHYGVERDPADNASIATMAEARRLAPRQGNRFGSFPAAFSSSSSTSGNYIQIRSVIIAERRRRAKLIERWLYRLVRNE